MKTENAYPLNEPLFMQTAILLPLIAFWIHLFHAEYIKALISFTVMIIDMGLLVVTSSPISDLPKIE